MKLILIVSLVTLGSIPIFLLVWEDYRVNCQSLPN
jgi:hypothetical protein